MQLKQSCSIAIVCLIALVLSSCNKKSASYRSTRSDADLFFQKPTLQDYKQMHKGAIAGFDRQGGRSQEYTTPQGTDSVPGDEPSNPVSDLSSDLTTSNIQATAHNNDTLSLSAQDRSKNLSSQQYKQKLLDIPLPVDARPLADFSDYMTINELSLTRMSSLDQQQLLDFYISMLEQAGWRLLGTLKGCSESIMTWEKTRKICVVSLRSTATSKWALVKSPGGTRIVISICVKKKYA